MKGQEKKYKHFLIDEFQDTSTLQWENLLPLIENSLSESNLNMVVGDGKQAIYRWRNGDVEQFTNLPKIPDGSVNGLNNEREQALIRNYEEINLTRNYRSQSGIIDFNNDFFSFVSKHIPQPYELIYKDVIQQTTANKTKGYVQIDFIDDTDKEETFEEVNLLKAKEIIEKANADGFRLKDIAILCRSNKNASLMAQHLLTEGIDVVSAESLRLSKSPAINFIIACLKYTDTATDRIAEAEILNYLIRINKSNNDLNKEFISLAGKKNLKEHLRSYGY